MRNAFIRALTEAAEKDPRIVFVGHDGGLDVSNDGGQTWDYHNDIAVGQFYQVSADMRRRMAR